MGMKWSKKALPEVIPPRICITFRRASFWSRSKSSKILSKSSKIVFGELQTENTVNTGPGSQDYFSENVRNHEHLSKRDPYSTSRLRIKDFESQSCYEPNGTTGDPQNCYINFKIGSKSNGPNRPNCPLNLAINRMAGVWKVHQLRQPSEPQIRWDASGRPL